VSARFSERDCDAIRSRFMARRTWVSLRSGEHVEDYAMTMNPDFRALSGPGEGLQSVRLSRQLIVAIEMGARRSVLRITRIIAAAASRGKVAFTRTTEARAHRAGLPSRWKGASRAL